MEGNQYISLFDVFDYLEANGYIGCAEVSDRESNKTILFAKDGIYVVSKGRRKGMRLIEILRREGTIDKQTLEDALADERSTNYQKTLGEILVSLGEISPKVLEIKLRGIVESELYDLFLWKGAKYSFDPSATKESTFQNAGGYTFYQTDPVALGQSVVGKMNEWNLGPHSIPDLTTIFKMDDSQFGRLKDLGLTRKMIQESQFFGENSIQEILEQTSLLKSEICHLIFTLLREGILAPLNVEEAKRRAHTAEEQQNFGKAATYYGYVSFSGTPDINSVRKLEELLDKANRRHESLQMLDNVGWNYYEGGKFTNAIQVAELMLEHTPGYQSAVTLEFNSHAQLQNSERVLQVGETLGSLLVGKKRLKEAEEHYNYLLQWFPDNLDLRCALADVHIKSNNVQEGLKLLSACAEQFEKDGKKEDALRTYKQILDVDPQRKDISKKVRGMEMKKAFTKIFFVLLPIVLIVGAIGYYIHQERVKQQREVRAIDLYKQALDHEGKLPTLEKFKKELESTEEKDFQKLLDRYGAVDNLYLQILQQYKDTSPSGKADGQRTAFQKKYHEAKKAVEDRKAVLKKIRDDAEKQKAREEEKIRLAIDAKERGKELLEKGKYEEAEKFLRESVKHYMEFYRNFQSSQYIYGDKFKVPMLIDSVPRGAEVYEGDKVDLKKSLGITPLVYEYKAKTESADLIFTLKAKGFKLLVTDAQRDNQWTRPALKWEDFNILNPSLNMEPIAYSAIPAGPVESSFLMFQDLLLFGARDGNLYGVRFYGEETQPIWIQRGYGSFGDFFTSPVQIKNLAFFGNTNGQIVAFGKNSAGKVVHMWSQQTEGAIVDAPMVYKDPDVKDRYWMTFGNKGHYAHLYSLTWAGGKLLFNRYFSYGAYNEIVVSPVIDGSNLYVAGTDNMLACFDYPDFVANTANRDANLQDATWVFEGEDDFAVSPVLCLDSILQGCDDGFLYSINRETGKEDWKVYMGGPVRIAPILYPNNVQEEFTKVYNQYLAAAKGFKRGKLDSDQFSTIKKQIDQLKKRYISQVYVILCLKNTLVAYPLAELQKQALIAKQGGKVLDLTKHKGSFLWKHTLKGEIKEGPLVEENQKEVLLYVTTKRGYVYCFNIRLKPSDMLKWQYYSPTLSSPVYVWKNLLFFADRSRVFKGGQSNWEYRINCLMIRK